MAEYWKSTPRYWCKFCSLYVRDTKFERANHEATGRHQGNIQRSLKGIHREQQQQQREQQRAKDEVARLNGLVSGSESTSKAAAAPTDDARPGAKPTSSRPAPQERKATLEDRQKQLDQLIAMGVAVPEELRRDVALTGDWKVVSQRIVDEEGKDVTPKPSGLSTGVHKRKLEEDAEERELTEAAEMITRKKGWGKTYKTFPGKSGGGEEVDLDALLGLGKGKESVKKEEEEREEGVKKEEDEDKEGVKKEEEVEQGVLSIPTEQEAKKASEEAAPAVVFKKRKKTAK